MTVVSWSQSILPMVGALFLGMVMVMRRDGAARVVGILASVLLLAALLEPLVLNVSLGGGGISSQVTLSLVTWLTIAQGVLMASGFVLAAVAALMRPRPADLVSFYDRPPR